MARLQVKLTGNRLGFIRKQLIRLKKKGGGADVGRSNLHYEYTLIQMPVIHDTDKVNKV